jgi:hypothetical protein
MDSRTAESPRNQCWPQGVPFIFTNDAVQLLQQPDKITMLYDEDHEVRHVHMNKPHPAQVTPSWYGDSVGHYEGDTLLIDTVGFKIGPFSAVDQYGTPFTQALHVVERYRLIDYEAAKEAWERGGKENGRGGGIGERGRLTATIRARHYSSNSRSRTTAPSQPLGPQPKPIGAYSATGPKTSVLKTPTNTAPKKTSRSRLLRSRISETCSIRVSGTPSRWCRAAMSGARPPTRVSGAEPATHLGAKRSVHGDIRRDDHALPEMLGFEHG